MDFPISVPSIGLVNGKFVDEDPLAGTPGSLIPAQWGNAVTHEILAVIQAAGLTPDEDNNDQLLQAITELLVDATPAATETVSGLIQRATQVEAEAGLDDEAAMTALRVHQAIAKKAPASSVVVSTSVSKVLTAADLGLVLVDSTAGATTITLPASNAALGIRDVIVRRMDNGTNRLVVQATGAEKIKLHTHLNAAGYSFLVLMGAGDWWRLRSDGLGNWWPIGRADSTPLGNQVFGTTLSFSPGGWGAVSGAIFNRAEWPWLWDHALQSGMLVSEAARTGYEGCWTPGNGSTTFRAPEMRGEFLRVADETRGVDVGRIAGTSQVGNTPQVNQWGVSNISSALNFANGSMVSGFVITAASIIAGNSGENRPRNMAFPGRIKLI